MTALQPLLVAGAVALVLGLASALVVRAIVPALPRGSSALWAAAALAPIAATAIALVMLLTPDALSKACHCASHGDHHPHLCWVHPGYAGPLVVPALALISAWLLLRAPAIGRAALSIFRSSQLARIVRAAPATRIDGIAVHVLDCGEPMAFTAGLFAPRIVVDRLLGEKLDAQSLRAVVHHEHAHTIRRDGLTLAALRLAAACFSTRMLRPSVERWTSASEVECDRHAAARVGRASDVAAALVAVERLCAGCSSEKQLAPAISSADLAHRVGALLRDDARPANLASDVVSIMIVVTGLLLLAALWPGDAAHHFAEMLLGAALHR